MPDKQNKKFIRIAGKVIFGILELMIFSFSLKILLGYLGPEYINPLLGAQVTLMLTVYGMAGWSDYRKENLTKIINKEP